VAAELGFTHTAIAKHEDFYTIDGDCFYFEIENVGAEGGEAVLVKPFIGVKDIFWDAWNTGTWKIEF
jgi:hypothetical protein